MNNQLPTVRAAQLLVRAEQKRWLIEPLWGYQAAGILGGIPKCCKTWFGLDLAISVASGTKALDRYPPQQTGPTLVYLAEDHQEEIHARIKGYCIHRGIDIDTLDVHVITAPVVRLDLQADRQRLLATVEQIKPRLLLLDPLVRLHRLNENDATEVSGLLGFLRELQRTFTMAVLLTHHQSKRTCAQPGQALRGSSDLHAFGDSNAYLSRQADHLVVTLEHRAAPAPQPIRIKLVSRPDGSATHLETLADPQRPDAPKPLEQRICEALQAAATPLPQTELRQRLQVNNQRLGELLHQMHLQGSILRSASGWELVVAPRLPLPA